MVVGITGKSGVGKSTIAKNLAFEKGYFYLDIDTVGHEALDDFEVRKKIKEKFGIEVSSTNRRKLSEMVFTNRHKMKELSDISYEKMRKDIYAAINEHENIVLDWILLPHTEFFKLCDKKILVIAGDDEKRKELVMLRDNISLEDLELRDNASIEYNLNDYDEVIVQNYNKENLCSVMN